MIKKAAKAALPSENTYISDCSKMCECKAQGKFKTDAYSPYARV